MPCRPTSRRSPLRWCPASCSTTGSSPGRCRGRSPSSVPATSRPARRHRRRPASPAVTCRSPRPRSRSASPSRPPTASRSTATWGWSSRPPRAGCRSGAKVLCPGGCRLAGLWLRGTDQFTSRIAGRLDLADLELDGAPLEIGGAENWLPVDGPAEDGHPDDVRRGQRPRRRLRQHRAAGALAVGRRAEPARRWCSPAAPRPTRPATTSPSVGSVAGPSRRTRSTTSTRCPR